jgi:hypothetical protein
MGVVLILLGLVAAGVVADFVVENELTTAARESFELFGGSFDLSRPQLVLVAAVLGAVAVLFVILGLGVVRGSWGRRRSLKQRMAELESENTSLRSKLRLVDEIGDTRHRDRGDAGSGG